ncbi:MAG: hypothetical protein WDN06_21990 [Asticcacaulis sp.]
MPGLTEAPSSSSSSDALTSDVVVDSSSTSESSSAAPPFTGTIATLDLPGASSSSSSSAGPVKPVVVPPDKKTLRKLNDAAVAYVRNQRGWMDGSYKVYFYGYDNDLTIMAIDLTQGDNAYNFVSAEGQPFKVEIDPATMQVKRELY